MNFKIKILLKFCFIEEFNGSLVGEIPNTCQLPKPVIEVGDR